MNETEHTTTFELRDYLRVLRTRKWTVVLVLVITVGIALAVSLTQEPIYQAEARVLIKPPLAPTDDSVAPPANIQAETESQLIVSESVAALVADDLDADIDTRTLLRNVTVEPVEGTLVVGVRYQSEEPDRAAEIANAFAENYTIYRQKQAKKDLRQAQQAVEQQISRLNDRVSGLQDEIDEESSAEEPDLDRLETLRTEERVLISQLGVLQQELDAIQPNRSSKLVGGELIDPAVAPESPASPNHIKSGAFAVVLGLVMGLGMAFIRERLDDRFRGRREAERAIGVPVIASIPRFKQRRRFTRKHGPRPVLLQDPHSPASEAYRRLGTNISLLASRRGHKCFVVTSALAQEGKTVTTANLGVALAQAGYRVCLVSGDLRHPGLEDYFGVDTPEGLTSWLAGDEDKIDVVIKGTELEDLKVIPCGPARSNPAENLNSPRLAQLVQVLRETFDIILFDSAPILPVTDSVIIASNVDATVMVLRAGRTRKSATVQAADDLNHEQVRLVGTVLNAFAASQDPYSGYGYYYPGREVVVESDEKESRRPRSILGRRRRG